MIKLIIVIAVFTLLPIFGGWLASKNTDTRNLFQLWLIGASALLVIGIICLMVFGFFTIIAAIVTPFIETLG